MAYGLRSERVVRPAHTYRLIHLLGLAIPLAAAFRLELELGYSPPGSRSCTPLPAFLVLLTSPAVAGLRWSGLGQDSDADGELPAQRRGLTGGAAARGPTAALPRALRVYSVKYQWTSLHITVNHSHMPYRVFRVDAGSDPRRAAADRTTRHDTQSQIGSCDPTKIEVASKKASKPQRTVDAPLAIATLRF